MFSHSPVQRSIAYLATLVVSVAAATALRGQTTIDWNNPAGGNYNTAANWNPANVPNTATETARFNLAQTFTVTFAANSSTTIDDLLVNTGDVTFSNAGFVNDATLNISDDAILDGGDLTLARVGGTTADVNFVITDDLSIQGGSELSIETTSQIQATSDVRIGDASNGTLAIAAGGSVSNFVGTLGVSPGATGTATVTGAGSTWSNTSMLVVGGAGAGILTIEAGGDVSSSGGDLGFSSFATGMATVTGAASTWNNSGSMIVGRFGTGTLAIEAGGSVSNLSVSIASNLNSSGTATVAGDGSLWTNNGDLRVGQSGTATLTITGGGNVSNTDGFIAQGVNSTGTATVAGAGSTWTNSGSLFVGGNTTAVGGQATLTIGPGGTVSVADTLKIWDQGSINLHGGTIRIDGYDREPTGTFNFLAGTIQLAGDRNVGTDAAVSELFGPAPTIPFGKGLTVEGTATLLTPVILDGGTLSVGQVVNPQLIDLQRGTLNITNQPVSIEPGGPFGETLDLAAATTVNVTLGITNHGLVTGDGRLGGSFHNDTDGELRAEPGRSLTLAGTGNTNDGQINLLGGLLEFTADLTNDGGTITGNGTLIAADGLVNDGTMTFSGPTNVLGDVENSASGLVISSGGGPTTFFGGVTNDGEIRTHTGGFTVFLGALSGSGTFTGPGTINPEGMFSPGSSPGTVLIEGHLALGTSAARLIDHPGRPPVSSFDIHEVGGTASLAGALDVSLIDGFTPVPGSSFEVLTADGGISGTFDSVTLPALTGANWQLVYNATSMLLQVALPGDYNFNGIVDAADYSVWRDMLGQTGTGLAADGDGDGMIAMADYDVWNANFGQSLGSGSGFTSTTVPEPASLVLLGLGILFRGRIAPQTARFRVTTSSRLSHAEIRASSAQF